jgi:hypothetical protein
VGMPRKPSHRLPVPDEVFCSQEHPTAELGRSLV